MVGIKVNASSFVVDAICIYIICTIIKHLHPPTTTEGEDFKRKDDTVVTHTKNQNHR